MVNDQQIKEAVVEILYESFFKYFSKVKKETTHIILDNFFPEQRRVSSVMSGLQTSLGTYWEKLSIQLAIQNSFNVIPNSDLQKPEKIPDALAKIIESIKEKRQDHGGELDDYKKELNTLSESEDFSKLIYKVITKGKGSDLIFEKDGKVYIFDTKTVQVNANNGNTFNETLILWLAYYKLKTGMDAINIYPKLIFPYNSGDLTNDKAWWKDYGARVAPLTKKDVLVGNEYWSFLTDNSNAMNAVIEGINEVCMDTKFIELYQKAFHCETKEEAKLFSAQVKLDRVCRVHNLKIIDPEVNINTRKKYEWEHIETGYKLRETIPYLLRTSIVIPKDQVRSKKTFHQPDLF